MDHILSNTLPSWMQLAGRRKKVSDPYWNDKNMLWTCGSGESIRLIIQTFQAITCLEKVMVWLPDFFCLETENLFVLPFVSVLRYPITKALEPDWKWIRKEVKENRVDIFLQVHYFGGIHDMAMAREFCNQNKAIFIEDCAHMLLGGNILRERGDFVLFSPHKSLPVPEGGIIKWNLVDERTRAIVELMGNDISTPVYSSAFLWKCKKIIQKILQKNKKSAYSLTEHYGDVAVRIQARVSLSKQSKDWLMGYTYEDLKEYAYIRRKNLCMMNELMARIAPESYSLLPKESFCPYVAAYSLENVADKDNVTDMIHKLGIPMTFWPNLHPDVRHLESAETARNLSRNILVLPVHQDIRPMQLAKRWNMICSSETGSQELILHWIKGDDVQMKEIWCNLPIELLSVAQDWNYGDAKERAQKWKPDRAIIMDHEKTVGILQALVKRVAGIPVAVRVRRGPAFIKEYHRLENMLYIMDLIKKKYKLPIFYEPNEEFSPSGLAMIQKHGWKCWNYYGYPSGIIDLTKPLEEIRKNFDRRWRRHLRIAEDSGLQVMVGNDRYTDILVQYSEYAGNKGFEATDERILLALFEMRPCPLLCYRIENARNEIIACRIVYFQKYTAYAYVSMNFEEGREVCANNFLYYSICKDLQEKGIKYFDLTGIEPIHTEQIAEFKDGMNPVHYELSGEMIWLPGM